MASNTTVPRGPPPPPPPPPLPPSQAVVITEISQVPLTIDTKTLAKSPSSLSAAADLIRTLDSAFAEMSSLSTEAAKDVEEARRNARAASEVARRYAARSYTNTSFPPASAKDSDWEYWIPTSTGGDTDLPTTPGSGGRKRKMMKTPSTSERLAQSHAEDVLSLSLELERTKQELENERMAHDHTRSSLTEHKSKHVQLEGQIHKVLSDLETSREEHAREMQNLKEDLTRANRRVQAADEDAQLALDLAKGNADSREQLEVWLQRALHEVQTLRDQLDCVGVSPDTMLSTKNKKKQHVHFAESTTVVTVPNRHIVNRMNVLSSPLLPPPPPPRSPRSMVAAGRHLLQKVNPPSTPHPVVTIALTPKKSAERRQELRERLRAAGEDLPSPLQTVIKNSPSVNGIDMGMATKAMETCKNVASLIRESGLRLDLPGHWWTLNKLEDNIEAMVRQYCNSLEVSLCFEIHLPHILQ